MAIYVHIDFPDLSFSLADRKLEVADKFRLGYLFHPTL